jgi:hypothetical protein
MLAENAQESAISLLDGSPGLSSAISVKLRTSISLMS